MNNLNSKQRKYLRGLAHHLDSAVIIGKNKLSTGSINSINESLFNHELIKVKFLDQISKNNFKKNILEQTESSIVGSIGRLLILYKQNEDSELRKIHLPK